MFQLAVEKCDYIESEIAVFYIPGNNELLGGIDQIGSFVFVHSFRRMTILFWDGPFNLDKNDCIAFLDY